MSAHRLHTLLPVKLFNEDIVQLSFCVIYLAMNKKQQSFRTRGMHRIQYFHPLNRQKKKAKDLKQKQKITVWGLLQILKCDFVKQSKVCCMQDKAFLWFYQLC